MKAPSMICLLLGLVPALAVKTVQKTDLLLDDMEGGERPITKIVAMLESLAAQSEQDAEAEKEVFQKFECYCTNTIEEKVNSIDSLNELIEDTEIRIEKLNANTAEMEAKKVQINKDLNKNNMTQIEANGTRQNTKEAFEKEERDMEAALGQLQSAYDKLSGQETEYASLLETSSDPALLAVTRELNEVAAASNEFLKPQEKIISMLRTHASTPGNYTDQGGKVLGVLRSTKDSYIGNLADLRAAENKSIKDHNVLVQTLLQEQQNLKDMLAQTESTIASNTAEIDTKTDELNKANADLQSSKDVKALTEKTYKTKTEAYEKRKVLRSEEQAAIAEAVTVLNSDSAFAAFGKTEATTKVTPSTAFIQLASSHGQASNAQTKSEVVSFLRQAARRAHSVRLAHLATALSLKPWSPETEKQNPFNKVLAEIGKMQTVIDKESKADKDKFNWCQSERADNNNAKGEKETDLGNLQERIVNIDNLINSASTGLVPTLKTAETDLSKNQDDQTSMTAARKKENEEYQQNIANLQGAEKLIEQALKILDDYYTRADREGKQIEQKVAFVQVKSGAGADPDPQAQDAANLETYQVRNYEGGSATGRNIMQLIQNILADTQKEEEDAHAAEQQAQADFEDNMQALTQDEANERSTIASKKKELADSRLELDKKKDERAATQKEKAAIEAYLKEIKPGCDFITTNFDQRVANRQAESRSLANTIALIKDTPAYKQFEEAYAEEWKNLK